MKNYNFHSILLLSVVLISLFAVSGLFLSLSYSGGSLTGFAPADVQTFKGSNGVSLDVRGYYGTGAPIPMLDVPLKKVHEVKKVEVNTCVINNDVRDAHYTLEVRALNSGATVFASGYGVGVYSKGSTLKYDSKLSEKNLCQEKPITVVLPPGVLADTVQILGKPLRNLALMVNVNVEAKQAPLVLPISSSQKLQTFNSEVYSNLIEKWDGQRMRRYSEDKPPIVINLGRYMNVVKITGNSCGDVPNFESQTGHYYRYFITANKVGSQVFSIFNPADPNFFSASGKRCTDLSIDLPINTVADSVTIKSVSVKGKPIISKAQFTVHAKEVSSVQFPPPQPPASTLVQVKTLTPTPVLTILPTIKLLSPNGGEQLRVGDTYMIKWESTGDLPMIDLRIHAGPGPAVHIAKDIPNTGSYDWKIPEKSSLKALDLRGPKENYFVRVDGRKPKPGEPTNSIQSASDNSDTSFKISPALPKTPYPTPSLTPKPTITPTKTPSPIPIITPTPTPVVLPPKSTPTPAQRCTDTDGGKDYFKRGRITLPNGQVLDDTCGSQRYEGYVVEYHCDAEPYVENYKCNNGCENGVCLQKPKTLTPQPTPVKKVSVKVISPNGGETLKLGETYRIKWDSQLADKVFVGYTTGSGSANWIATYIPNTGYYDWKVDVPITAINKFKIAVLAYQSGVTGASSITDESDNFFSIIQQPKFAVTQPSPTVTPTPTITSTPSPNSLQRECVPIKSLVYETCLENWQIQNNACQKNSCGRMIDCVNTFHNKEQCEKKLKETKIQPPTPTETPLLTPTPAQPITCNVLPSQTQKCPAGQWCKQNQPGSVAGTCISTGTPISYVKKQNCALEGSCYRCPSRPRECLNNLLAELYEVTEYPLASTLSPTPKPTTTSTLVPTKTPSPSPTLTKTPFAIQTRTRTPVVPTQIECNDSDGGKDYYTQGIVTRKFGGSSSTYKDMCNNLFGYKPVNGVREMYCSGTDFKTEVFDCPNGCENGACRKILVATPTPSLTPTVTPTKTLSPTPSPTPLPEIKPVRVAFPIILERAKTSLLTGRFWQWLTGQQMTSVIKEYKMVVSFDNKELKYVNVVSSAGIKTTVKSDTAQIEINYLLPSDFSSGEIAKLYFDKLSTRQADVTIESVTSNGKPVRVGKKIGVAK